MPIPTTNKEPQTVDEFIVGAEEWGDTEIFSEEKLRGFCQRMMSASDEYETEVGSNVGRKKIIIKVYHPNCAKADAMSNILAGGFRACNGLLNEIFRLRALVRKLEETTNDK